MSISSAAILDWWDVTYFWMLNSWWIILKREVLVNIISIFDWLKLLLITLHLLFQVLDSFGNTLCNFEVVLDLLHGCSWLSLFQSIFSKCLMSILELSDLISLELNLSHFSMIVCYLLIVIVVSRLLILLQLVNWLTIFASLFSLSLLLFLVASILRLITLVDDSLSLFLGYLNWVLLVLLSY